VSGADEGQKPERREHQRRGRLLAVGVILIAAGVAVLVLSVMKGMGSGFGVFPGLVLVVLGGVFVLISANVDHVDVNLGDRRAGLHVSSGAESTSALPVVRAVAGSPAADGKQRRPRQCRLVKRNRV
jgi:hypothetical protein